MNKSELISGLRSHYPKIARKKLAKARLNIIKKYRISPKDVKIAEESENNKEQAVRRFEKKHGKKYSSLVKASETVIRNAPEFKDLSADKKEKLICDMVFKYIAYGFQPDEYLCYELLGKTPKQCRQFISDTDRYSIVYSINDISDQQCFLNKIKCYTKFGEYYKRDAVIVRGSKDYDNYLKFVEKHSEFVQKKTCASRGHGVELKSVGQSSEAKQQYFNSLISSGKYLLEERVAQGKQTAVLNPSSVNTIRCITFNTKHGVKVAYTFMKVGRAGSFVDNGGAGGILVGIDKDTGVLDSNGIDENNVVYTKHPDSGIVFKGYQLPDWQSMLDMCIEMSSKAPTVKYIGWDVAYSDSGWVLIEGNMGQFIGPQTIYKIGIKKQVQEYLKDMEPIPRIIANKE